LDLLIAYEDVLYQEQDNPDLKAKNQKEQERETMAGEYSQKPRLLAPRAPGRCRNRELPRGTHI